MASILKIVQRTQCPFAVKSGGHAAFTGASNIANGITIDLKRINELAVSHDKTLTRVGPGNVWIDVYDYLTPKNLTVVGGRVTGIGTGGLTLGGGISFFSGRHGWACDGVRNYEVVMADGRILDVNHTSYPDLYFALRGGGNNFGVVTRLDLETFPQGQMWGGAAVSELTDDTRAGLINAMENFAHRAPEAPDAAVYVAWVYSPAQKAHFTSTELTYAQPLANPPIFANFTAVPTISSTLRITNLTDIAREINQSNPNGLRETYQTHTLGMSKATMNGCLDIWLAETATIANVSGILPALIYQPITDNVIEKFRINGGNCLGIDESQGPLLLMSNSIMWTDPTADDLVLSTNRRIIDRCVEKSRELGQFNRYIYQNYAAAGQPVFEGYGESNLRKLREISKKYDPQQFFQKLQPGYFKLYGGGEPM